MGFWDFFKKKIKEEQIQNEKISIEELDHWILDKQKEIKEQEQAYFKQIQTRIFQLIQELEQGIFILKEINIDEKKAEEKIKLIVKENLSNYIDYLRRLIIQLKELDKEEKEIIEKINLIFQEFKKRSAISYEKATFLIGKELENVKETIRIFFKDLENIIKDNQGLIDKSKIIFSVETKIKDFSENKKIKVEIEESIKEYNEDINKLRKKIEIKEKEIENITSSEKFIEQEKKIGEINKKEEELEKEIDRLREIINFKALTNFFHIFEERMKIIKTYKENFKEAFKKTKGEDLVSLFKEAKLPNYLERLNRIQDISEKEKEIENIVIEETGIQNLKTWINKIKSEIDMLNSGKLTKEKRFKKIDENLNKIISLIKEDLIKMNVEIK